MSSHDQMLEEAASLLEYNHHHGTTQTTANNNNTTFHLYPGLEVNELILNDQKQQQQPQDQDHRVITDPTMMASPSQVISKMSSSPTLLPTKSDSSKALLISVGVGVCGGYMSGNIVRIGSRVVFGAVAALLLAGSTFTALNREALKRKKQQQDNEPSNLEQYEMLAKMGIEAANQHIKRMNIKETILEQWEKLREYTKDNYPLTSSFLIGFILAMF
ncbi:hypothetical protein C9374_005155 [Naegleria lovaniensis]|uniref:Transmembrane protein n=1 Tax=Naegleria lovaniensis TaxID=51637 RepID=A0AA88GR61_NAELO|nr:uncharacterized protein C9374_005155 [Naegleria lovaniensis]KAG2382575.1 hypothetical protein C9374_005155 [Naegleria lovaniensis]